MIFQAEAEVRWLDHCEASLARYCVPVPLPVVDVRQADAEREVSS